MFALIVLPSVLQPVGQTAIFSSNSVFWVVGPQLWWSLEWGTTFSSNVTLFVSSPFKLNTFKGKMHFLFCINFDKNQFLCIRPVDLSSFIVPCPSLIHLTPCLMTPHSDWHFSASCWSYQLPNPPFDSLSGVEALSSVLAILEGLRQG